MGRYNSGTWRSPECYIGGYYWFSAVGGQERSKYGPDLASFINIFTKLLALKPSRGPLIGQGSRKKTQINWGNRLGSISGVLGPFRGLYRAPKPTVLHWVYSASRILGHILTFSDPPSQPSQIILVQNDLKRCPTYSTTVLCSTRTSRGYLRPSEVRFKATLAFSGDLF